MRDTVRSPTLPAQTASAETASAAGSVPTAVARTIRSVAGSSAATVFGPAATGAAAGAPDRAAAAIATAATIAVTARSATSGRLERPTGSARSVAGGCVAGSGWSAAAGRSRAWSRHSPGTPLRTWTPRSANRSSEPATRSTTVLETSTSPGAAWAATRAPMWTAIPPTPRPSSSTSPVCTPARTCSPSATTASVTAAPQRTAWAGCSKVAKKPSPAVSTSRPPNRRSSRRTAAWCRASRSLQARSPRRAASSVDPTMSVNRTVARTRPPAGARPRPGARNRSTPRRRVQPPPGAATDGCARTRTIRSGSSPRFSRPWSTSSGTSIESPGPSATSSPSSNVATPCPAST